MTKRTILTLTTLTLLVSFIWFAANPLNTVDAVQTVVQLKWTNPMAVYDMVVSGDGNYVAAVNNTGLYYFDTDSQQPIWWYQPPQIVLMSVAISADGDYVVAGDNTGFIHYFNQSRIRTENQALPTWTSYQLGGPIERGTLDISANGNYTVLGGTGTNIWYYANCTKRTGPLNQHTWTSYVSQEFRTVHISANGKYVAGGGYNGQGGFVAFFKDADERSGYVSPTWHAYRELSTMITDLALSEDGYAIAAIDSGPATLYYWANATDLTGDPSATWTTPGSFSCVDMSGDGSKVVTGGYYLTSLHFWADCRTRNGTQREDWIRLETKNVYDVAIGKDGNLIAAPAMGIPSNYTAYFLTQDGEILDGYPLPEFANMVSMSVDGATVAMAGPGWDSLYLFKLEEDATPPAINKVWQQPNSTSVYPNSTVNVFANVTDDLSGVKQVTMNYTTGNGTWFTQTMQPLGPDIWIGTIPAFPNGTTVTYLIIAEDKANNTITSQELGYTLEYEVIPELTISLVILLFTALASVAVASSKRKSKTQT